MTCGDAGMRIAKVALAQATAHARATPDREVCGLLLGSAALIEHARATRNVASDPRRWFEVDPAALFAALRAERAGGPLLLGHYHSHPNGSAAPSPRDLAAAEPGRLWLIVAGDDARLWRATDGGFRPLALWPC